MQSWWHGFSKGKGINARCHCLSHTATLTEAEPPEQHLRQQGWKEGPGVGAGSRTWAGGEDPGDTADALACGGLLGDTLVAPLSPTYSTAELSVWWGLCLFSWTLRGAWGGGAEGGTAVG